MDIAFGYQIKAGNSYFSKASDDLKETTYYELTHAGHYALMKGSWYDQFVNAELSEIITNVGGASSLYGGGGASYSPIIALGESWAYHMGEYMADRRYGNVSSAAGEQFSSYYNGYGGSGLNCHLVALELYDPNLAGYPFNWIPKGLYYDLLDTRVENKPPVGTGPVNDSVSGYTNQQMFNAFNSTILSIQSYKTNFIQQNNITSANVTNLFQSYGY